VADRPFTLLIDVSGEPASSRLVAAVASGVLSRAGCVPAAADGLVGRLAAAAADACGDDGRCTVRFDGRDDRIEVTVSSVGGEVWRSSCPTP
jgi:hypothetical protein